MADSAVSVTAPDFLRPNVNIGSLLAENKTTCWRISEKFNPILMMWPVSYKAPTMQSPKRFPLLTAVNRSRKSGISPILVTNAPGAATAPGVSVESKSSTPPNLTGAKIVRR